MCDKQTTQAIPANTGQQWDSNRVARALDAEKAGCAAGSLGIPFATPHRIIESLIEYHNRMANDLNRLRRAIPEEMNYEAERALMTILNEYSRHKVF